jgi:ABC-type Fe3+/spermidine/putrescine transport system ATPase subunit
VVVSIRPEDVLIHPACPDPKHSNVWSGTVKQLVYLGDHCQCEIKLGSGTIMKVRVHPGVDLGLGQKVYMAFDPRRCVAVPE